MRNKVLYKNKNFLDIKIKSKQILKEGYYHAFSKDFLNPFLGEK